MAPERPVVVSSSTAGILVICSYQVLLLWEVWCRLMCDHLAPHHNSDAFMLLARLRAWMDSPGCEQVLLMPITGQAPGRG